MMKKILYTFFLIFWGLTANAQPDKIQQTPFGQVELLSCSTALRYHHPVYLAVATEINEGWTLDEPNFNIYTSNNSPAMVLTPFKQPYTSAALYPISVTAQKTGKPITFTVRGFWRACKQDTCVTEPIRLALTLGTNLPLLTPECSGITLALSNSPIPSHMQKITTQAIKEGDAVHVVLDFPKRPGELQVFDEQKQPLDLDIQIKGKRASFYLPQGDENTISFIAKTRYHYYQIEAAVQSEGSPIIPPAHSTAQILWAAFLCFFFSAAPIYWARSTTMTRTKFRAGTKQMMRLTLSIGTVLLILLCTRGTFNLSYYPLPKLYTIIAMTVGLLFIPASPLLVALFMFIMPKPYFVSFDESLIVTQICLVITSTFFIWLAFGAQRLWERKIFTMLQGTKNISAIWWIARLPWLALILYTCFYL